MKTITIIGAGMMGSALAFPLTDNGHAIRLVGTHLDEAIIGLAISCTMNPAAQIAAEKLNELRGCEVHMTHIVTPGDEAGLRRLGCRYTSDPYYATNALFTAGQ